MKAIILAAGRGERLGAAAGGRPKCLLRYGGKTLLQRHIEILDGLGVARIFVVTGYGREQIFETLHDLDSQTPVATLTNLKFEQGSVVSLFQACHILGDGTDTILMDADVLYDPAILGRLCSTRVGNCLLLDRDFEPGDEPVKICVSGATPVEFRKLPDPAIGWDYQGESVGFFRFDADMSERLRQKTREYIEQDRVYEPYEEVIRDLLRETPELFHIEDVTGLDWIEIDFPEDVARALELFNNAGGRWR
ncbi:MAG: phosphocholine cytidylyltransferase family protein [Gammaproteobacteria bacterium]|nr:phosphocholine cytidylyltransferase family protein [Gammaproteobacteria bacterium]MCY4283230.1 phosphocholine cytidylyltransferase family protein [Gammaproteobacteria bacterium]MCY4337365.1 phosphocholine cytidylyltransferase family protein [Gammaproteobacteria bacterium]